MKPVKIKQAIKEAGMDSLVIVDCQYDFIDGSLACNPEVYEAVAYLY